jgi:hypothetical protein
MQGFIKILFKYGLKGRNFTCWKKIPIGSLPLKFQAFFSNLKYYHFSSSKWIYSYKIFC